MSKSASKPLPTKDLLSFYHIDLPELAKTIEKEIKAFEKSIAMLEKVTPPTWDNFIDPLSQKKEVLFRMWSVIGHMHGVNDSKEVRQLYNKLLPKISKTFSEFGKNSNLFLQTQKLKSSSKFRTLSPTQKQVINLSLRDFILEGAGCEVKVQKKLVNINQKLAKASAGFDENLLDSTKAFSFYSQEESEIAGIPDDILAIAKADAQTDKNKSAQYKFNLQAPTYSAVIEYAQNRKLREHFYKNYVTRASHYLPGKSKKSTLDNLSNINQILKLRQKKAKLLGFDNYSQLSLASKMAKTPIEVERFLQGLSKRAYKLAEKELLTLQNKAMQDGVNLKMWDVAYYSRILRQEQYGFDDNEVKQYFPIDKVLSGVFELLHKLFNITLTEEKAPVWHPQVKFYRLSRAGKKLGGVYCDFYARNTKKSGAWMDEAIARGKVDDKFYQPIAQLVCNFTPPINKSPSLLTHDDLQTLLHEFGHVLHHILSEVDELEVSGTRAVEWDAVELPSQWLEEFAWNHNILRSMSTHIKTGRTLPKQLFLKMQNAKNFNSALATLRQITFGLFDLNIHTKTKKVNVEKTFKKISQTHNVLPFPKYYAFPQSFSHIFAGSYSAGYYSYKWAELLSCDAFAMFEEGLIKSNSLPKTLKRTGESFRREIMAVGGSRSAIKSFINLRGRKPHITPLLKSHALV